MHDNKILACCQKNLYILKYVLIKVIINLFYLIINQTCHKYINLSISKNNFVQKISYRVRPRLITKIGFDFKSHPKLRALFMIESQSAKKQYARGEDQEDKNLCKRGD